VGNVRAVDYNENEIDAWSDGDNVCFDRDEKRFVTLYFSEDIEPSSSLTGCQPSLKYQISSSLNETVISEKMMLLLSESYASDYQSLKKQLEIPEDVDFSFSLEFSPADKIEAGKPSEITREIFSETVRKEVLRKTGIPEFGQLIVSVW